MSLNNFFSSIGTTRQSFHAKLDRQLSRNDAMTQLMVIVDKVRINHPGMNLRDLYWMISPGFIGRDAFEGFFMNMGYGVEIKKAFRRTTNSFGVIRFDNLTEGIELDGVNQLWVSDITYYRIGDRFYYLTFIMDMFSRLIVGHSVSRNLRTEYTTIPALKKSLRLRQGTDLNGLVFHSDGGAQYYSKDFIKLTKEAAMVNSMGISCYNNPNAERLNGIIKNNYLKHYAPTNFDQLIKMTDKAVKMYNGEKPHSALNKMNPVAFENKIKKMFKEKELINVY